LQFADRVAVDGGRVGDREFDDLQVRCDVGDGADRPAEQGVFAPIAPSRSG